MPIESGYKSWTKSKIVELLKNNDKAVERALIVIFNNQELDEQSTDSTHKANGVGFTAFDAEILSSFAKHILKGRSLSVKQMAIARKQDKFGNIKIAKYWKQLQAEIVRKESEAHTKRFNHCLQKEVDNFVNYSFK